MRFGAILALIQGWSNQGSKDALSQLSWNWVLKVDLGTHLRDKHGKLFLWDLELFWPPFKVGQTNVENLNFCPPSRIRDLKVDLGTHLRDKHGELFLWDLELFWPSFKVGKMKVENMHFCRLSWNWVLKVDLGTHLRDKDGQLFLWYLDVFWPSFKDLGFGSGFR